MMTDHFHISDFLNPISLAAILQDEEYKDGQIGKYVSVYENDFPEMRDADLVLIGCGEERGNGAGNDSGSGPDKIREYFYRLYNWHPDIRLADIGNIKTGANLADTYAALKTVIKEIIDIGKTVVIIGGSHDLTLPQYYAYADQKKIIEAICVDALIDLNVDSDRKSDNFLMEMLAGEPNFVRHYNHIGFQSYYAHPRMLQTLDKLRFDCFRLGNVKENIEEMEPVVRNAQLFSFDIRAIANAYAPSHSLSPNGLTGEEACTLMRYAGLSPTINTIGIYGYVQRDDKDDLTARQISHMLWYLMDGRSRGIREARFNEKDAFNEFHTAFAEVETTFLQSKKTGRWWMQLPDQQFIACSHKDYILASSNEVPERWLRAQERN